MHKKTDYEKGKFIIKNLFLKQKKNNTIDLNNRLIPQLNKLNSKSVKNITIGNRIPKDFFITSGIGESDLAVHAGSFHLALKDAQIEMCNIMTYSSILPGIAQEIPPPEKLSHGSVMECILAVANSRRGIRATAGIIYGWLFHKKTGEKYGGLVCKYNGHSTINHMKKKLTASLDELYSNGYATEYNLKDINQINCSFVPKKKYGTSLVGLCFTNYLIPVIQ